MINVSREFKQNMAEDNRDFLVWMDLTLADKTVLHLDNSHLWENSLKIDEGVTASNQFTIGSCIINKLTFTLNNIYDDFSAYDFDGAVVVVYMGLQLSKTVEKIRKGIFTVDEPQYNGSTIVLECLDNMSKFDVDYADVKTVYPSTLGEIVRDICSFCGVSMASADFDNRNYEVAGRPNDESLTCRQVLAYCAQLACCFGRCDTYGRLEFRWFEQGIFEKNDNLDGGVFDDAEPYVSGGELDGGNFDDYKSGDLYDGGTFSGGTECHADGGDFGDYSSGTKMDGGGFDDSPVNYQSGDSVEGGNFTDYLAGDSSDGGVFEDLDLFHHLYSLSGFTVSTDDVVITGVQVTEEFAETEKDKKKTVTVGSKGYVLAIAGNKFIQKGHAKTVAQYLGNKLIGLKFRPMSTQALSDPTIEAGDLAYVTDQRSNTYNCLITNLVFSLGGFMNVSCDAETPGKNSSKQYSELTQAIVEVRREAQKQASNLATVMSQSFGVFKTEEAQEDGSIVYYMHDKPTLAQSMNVWKFTAGAFAVSTDGGKTWNAGMDADGNATVNILSAIGINCDWIHSGTLTLGGIDNINGKLVMLDADGNIVGLWNKDGIDVRGGSIRGADLTLGGTNNKYGKQVMLDAEGNEMGRWDSNGLYTTGPITSDNPRSKYAVRLFDGTCSLIGSDGKKLGAVSVDINTVSVFFGVNTGSDAEPSYKSYIRFRKDGNTELVAQDALKIIAKSLKINGRVGKTGTANFSDGSYLKFEAGLMVGGKIADGTTF